MKKLMLLLFAGSLTAFLSCGSPSEQQATEGEQAAEETVDKMMEESAAPEATTPAPQDSMAAPADTTVKE
ncbi:MAG: hypothetical protein A3H98_06085 [Bacteroidetes bacterium RIFCSPLOWO2_02_FULL_36_8]|nr:MAG: hypothetical protein A3H98_06085 [Bacteroidetes bacterium RIFCSPLOWO2_02_FULL_36_8]OFY72073.1 MAG: hypothetical protein A3G23_06820 [Bacteroidetes bacterium RIFCSPLOWO2_12_FULL_37_12]